MDVFLCRLMQLNLIASKIKIRVFMEWLLSHVEHSFYTGIALGLTGVENTKSLLAKVVFWCFFMG
jgi:hypothetical protein